jgi:hypothetical protein
VGRRFESCSAHHFLNQSLRTFFELGAVKEAVPFFCPLECGALTPLFQRRPIIQLPRKRIEPSLLGSSELLRPAVSIKKRRHVAALQIANVPPGNVPAL